MMRGLLLIVLLAAPLGAQGRVVILGVDGMDHALTMEFMAQGELPELAALAAAGTCRPILPTNPAQSPTSWASLTTGLDPGRTGIFGFLRRTVGDGQIRPEMTLVEVEERTLVTPGARLFGYAGVVLLALLPWILLRRRPRLRILVAAGVLAFLLLLLRWFLSQLPETLNVPQNRRGGAGLWECLDAEGVPVTSLFAPCAFPAPELRHGHLLCGLGVPDLLGTPGSVTVFREEPVPGGGRTTQMGGRDLPLTRAADGLTLEGASLAGPRNPLTGEPMRLALELRSGPEGTRLRLQGEEILLEVGRFSPLVPVSFSWGEVAPPLRGLVSYRLLRGEPHPVIYQEPLQFDPRHQLRWAPLTSPLAYGEELAAGGLFETAGWATATNPHQDELIDDATLIDDVERLVARRHAMVLSELAKEGWRVFFALLSTPDRVQHMFWRDRDPEHPAHDPEASRRRGDLVRESYRRVDELVGQIRREALRPDDVLLVVSDHGFAPFRYAVNLNRWLAEEGYLVARPDGTRTLDRDLGSVITNVEWARTRAYSLGLGRIWLNLKGREPGGVVEAEQAAALEAEIAQKLLRLEHQGQRVVHSVRAARDLYHGERVPESADLVVGFERGYRVSWNSCLLGLDEPVIFENRTRWSGDHCSVDPTLVPGVLFSSRPLRDAPASVTDIYPTLRDLLGLPDHPGLDGTSLVETAR